MKSRSRDQTKNKSSSETKKITEKHKESNIYQKEEQRNRYFKIITNYYGVNATVAPRSLIFIA